MVPAQRGFNSDGLAIPFRHNVPLDTQEYRAFL